MTPILAERQRVLQPVIFAPATVLTRELNRDSCLKAILLSISGALVTTFASGTPLADAQSTFDNLVENINITVDGSRIVKSVRPHMIAMQQLLLTKIQNDRRSSAGAAAVVNPTTDGGFVYGTTGQITTVYESLLLPFFNPYAQKSVDPARDQQRLTWLNLKGKASAEIRFATKGYASLLAQGNTAPVVFSASTLQINITTIEAQDVSAAAVFSDLKQTTKTAQFTAQGTTLIEIPKGNFLCSLMLFAQDGAAGSATTATGNMATNLLVNQLKLKLNGQQDVKSTSWLELQTENRARLGVQAPRASAVSRLDGIVLFDFLRDNDVSTAIPCRSQDGVDSVYLEVSTRGGSEFSYNASLPASLTIMSNELVLPA